VPGFRRAAPRGSVKWIEAAMRENPNWTGSLRTLVVSYVSLGRLEEARATAQQILRLHPGFTVAKWRDLTPLLGQQREDFLAGLRLAGIPEE
jgi:adenylate cyclase